MITDTNRSLTRNLSFLTFVLNILLVQCIRCVCGQTSINASTETSILVTNSSVVTGFNLVYLGFIIPIVIIVLLVLIVCVIKRKALCKPTCCLLP